MIEKLIEGYMSGRRKLKNSRKKSIGQNRTWIYMTLRE